MKTLLANPRSVFPFLTGLAVFILVMSLTTGFASASSAPQVENPSGHISAKDCGECHLDIADSWSHSPHANAFADPYFQEKWTALNKPGDCLACHTTDYIASTGTYSMEGVYCEACHGKVTGEHPPEVVSIRADTEYCGSCHPTTLSEWRSTGHSTTGVGCINCHNPHSQRALFENPDDLCINCHQEDMERYLEDLHVQKDIGCVDCHALVIPPEVIPDDGIVPTGHSFSITPATCVACHTDALHAGFSLPGFEHGATRTTTNQTDTTEIKTDQKIEEQILTPEQRIEALETALASRDFTTLFQGGVVGIVLGGTTAWVVARNVRGQAIPHDEDEEDENDEENPQE